MKTIKTENEKNISSKQVLEYYGKRAEMEKEKKDSRQRVMSQQLAKVTGGKNIIVSNHTR